MAESFAADEEAHEMIDPVKTHLCFVIVGGALLSIYAAQQFNQWTEAEEKKYRALSVGPPRHFTSWARFNAVRALYCLLMVGLYGGFVTVSEYQPGVFQSLLRTELSGIEPDGAWLVALLLMTGVITGFPPLLRLENWLRKRLHEIAFVPAKAADLATILACPSTEFYFDRDYVAQEAIPLAGETFTMDDFTTSEHETIAQKWCKLVYLLEKFAPRSKEGKRQWPIQSPYTKQFEDSADRVGKLMRAKRDDAMMRQSPPGSEEGIELKTEIKELLYDLYLLMSCKLLNEVRSVREVEKKFEHAYGIKIQVPGEGRITSSALFWSLFGIVLVVLLPTLIYRALFPDQPVIVWLWTSCAFSIHATAIGMAWLVFEARKKTTSDYHGPNRPSFAVWSWASAVVTGFACTLPIVVVGSLVNAHLEGRPALGWWDALAENWPWAWLGAATAAGVYYHLERTISTPATSRQRLVATSSQALLNMSVCTLVILATFGQSGTPHSNPIHLLLFMVVLTGLIGAVIGCWAPEAFRGTGYDRRVAATRFRVQGAGLTGVLSHRGRSAQLRVIEISSTGAVVELDRPMDHWITGTRAFVDFDQGPVNLPARLTRKLSATAQTPARLAIWFSSELSAFHLEQSLSEKLASYVQHAKESIAPQDTPVPPGIAAAI